jgi:DNA-binding NarL/FixJ family response regulator
MRILIADDQDDVRSALRVLLEHEESCFIIDEAENIENLYLQLGRTKPELLLLDWELSNRDMADDVAHIRKAAPGIRIIALSVRPEAQTDAKAAGVDAFVSKGDNSDKLLSVINMMI